MLLNREFDALRAVPCGKGGTPGHRPRRVDVMHHSRKQPHDRGHTAAIVARTQQLGILITTQQIEAYHETDSSAPLAQST